MNLNKRGRPFEYPRSFIAFLTFARDVWHLTFRGAEGFLGALGETLGFEAPDYTMLWRREAMEEIGDFVVPKADEQVLALDATGLSISPRREWIAHQCQVPRDFVKLHAAVDMETGAFVAAVATGGRKGNAARLPGLIKQAEERLDGRVVEVLADDAYDTRENFDFLKRRDIEAVIRMRKNANMKRVGGTSARPLAVQERNILSEEYWRSVKGYGRRWSAEGTFGAIKRMLDESLRSRREDLLLREAMRKVAAFLRMRITVAMPRRFRMSKFSRISLQLRTPSCAERRTDCRLRRYFISSSTARTATAPPPRMAH